MHCICLYMCMYQIKATAVEKKILKHKKVKVLLNVRERLSFVLNLSFVLSHTSFLFETRVSFAA